jgi:5-(carboxyamino)imidazole ribonucleotide synthase
MQKVGILGGGQLGRMLLQAAANYPVETYILESDDQCPAAHLCNHFIKGDIRDFETVYEFGKNLHAVTIEIENVNVDALEKLEAEGVKIYPRPSVLRIIQNKVLQKQFYQNNQIPTAPFAVLQSKEEIANWPSLLPGVQKLAVGGYDGRGVQSLKDLQSIDNAFDEESILEKKINLRKRLLKL